MILVGDNRVTLPTIETGSVQMVCTSPPYFGLRLYGTAGEEIGKERALDAYVSSIVGVMRECRRTLRDDGVAWVNLGDSYASTAAGNPGDDSKSTLVGGRGGGVNASQRADTSHCAPPGNALLVPFRVAIALQQDGWTLRAMLPWIKGNSMPESVQSRPSIAHEYVLFLTKRPSGYFYDADAVRVASARPELNYCNLAGRSLRSSDFWRAGAREAAEQLQRAADGEAVGMLTNDDAPAAFVVNPKGSGIQHFAMWPTRLVAPMVMAGTPEAGCCSECGAPWERVVEREGGNWERRKAHGAPLRYGDASSKGTPVNQLRGASFSTLGFRPSCSHDAPARPARILDPFVGAGTTIGVGEALGREVIGCELYQKNADLVPKRIAIVRAEVAEYLREQARGEEAHAIESEASGQIGLFARR